MNTPVTSFIYPSRYFVFTPEYIELGYFLIDPGIGVPKKLRETGPGSGEVMDIDKPIEPVIPLCSMVDDNRWF